VSKSLKDKLKTIFGGKSRSKKEEKAYRAAFNGLTDVDKADALENTTSPGLKPLAKAYKDEWNAMVDAENAGDFKTALDQVTKVQDAINQLVTAAEEADRKSAAAVTTVKNLSATDLKAKSKAEKIQLLKELRSGSAEMTDEQKAAQRAVYNAMDLDAEFLKQDAKNRKKIANNMTDTKEKRAKLRKHRKNWKKDPPAGPTKDEKLDLMREAIATQCGVLGIDPPPEVVEVDKPPEIITKPDGKTRTLITNGYFNPNDGKIYINTNARSSFNKRMELALDLALHENSHNYQNMLVKKLEDGTLTSGPEYEQALMFQANSGPRAYVKGAEDFETYKKQPLEEHAHLNGPETAKAIVTKLDPKKTK
jgi:hypothetical protein